MAQTPALLYQDEGFAIDYTPGSDVIAGQVVLLGSIPLIAPLAISSGVKGTLKGSGLWKVPKSSDTFTAGDAVYWDTTGNPVLGTAGSGAADSSAGSNKFMGRAAADAASGDYYVYVMLHGAIPNSTVGGSITADDITGSDSSLGIAGLPGSSSNGGAVAVSGGAGNGTGNAGGATSMTGGAGVAHTTGTGGAGGAISSTGGAGGTATSGTGGAGGASVFTSGAGGAASSSGTGGASGALGLVAGATGTTATGTGGAGGTISLTGAAGGAASGAAGIGGAGSAIAIVAGAGGATANTGSGISGVGGAITMTGGAGGACAATGAQASAAGGAVTIAGGASGTVAGSSAAAAGGAVSVTSGAGGAASSSGAGGASGAVTLASGSGGAGSATGTGGAGGLLSIAGGAGGNTSGAGTGGAGGIIDIRAGTGGTTSGGTAGADGGVYLNRVILKEVFFGRTMTALGTTQSSTPTAAQVLGGLLTQTGQTGAGTVTFPTGTAISAACPRTPATGDSFDLWFVNLGGGQTLTLTGATGTTVRGTATVASATNKLMRWICTGSNAWDILVTGG